MMRDDKPDDNEILNKLYFKIFGDIVKLKNPQDFIYSHLSHIQDLKSFL